MRASIIAAWVIAALLLVCFVNVAKSQSIDDECDNPVIVSESQIIWRGRVWHTTASPTSHHSDTLFEDASEATTDVSALDAKSKKKATKADAKARKKTAKIWGEGHDDLTPPFSSQFWTYAGCALVCVVLAALAAGLTVGIVSIDPFDLQIILETDANDCESDDELALLAHNKRSAAVLLPIVSKHHYVLVTLLLLNSISNEALPLFLDNLVPSWLAVLFSVTLVLVFGEIFPSAVFTGANQLWLAAKMAPIVWFFMIVFAPIAWPISKFLDCLLGSDDESLEYYKRGELKALIKLQGGVGGSDSTTLTVRNEAHPFSRGLQSLATNTALTADEVTILSGTLEMKSLTVGEVCVPFDSVFMLSIDDRLNADTLAAMLACGHSRIPIYDGRRSNIKGILLVKRLIVIAPEHNRLIRSLVLRRAMFVSPDMLLFDCLNQFQKGISHLAIVCSDPRAAEAASKAGADLPDALTIHGVITLEDLIERLIKEPIIDETDANAPHTVRAILEDIRVRRARRTKIKMIAKKLRRTTSSVILHKQLTTQMSPASATQLISPSSKTTRRSPSRSSSPVNAMMARTELSVNHSPLSTRSSVSNYGATNLAIHAATRANTHTARNVAARRPSRWIQLAERLGFSDGYHSGDGVSVSTATAAVSARTSNCDGSGGGESEPLLCRHRPVL